MALEINEIGIHIQVSDRAPVHEYANDETPDGRSTLPSTEALIDECVRRVLQRLRVERER